MSVSEKRAGSGEGIRGNILFGLAVTTSEGFPRWFVLVVVLGGLESIGAGLIQAQAGEPVLASRALTIIGPTVITLWLFVIGILLVRKGLASVPSTVGRRPSTSSAGAAS